MERQWRPKAKAERQKAGGKSRKPKAEGKNTKGKDESGYCRACEGAGKKANGALATNKKYSYKVKGSPVTR